MKNLSKIVALLGVVVAIAAAVSNPEHYPTLVTVFGENTAVNIAAVGAVVAGLGGSILNFFKNTTESPE